MATRRPHVQTVKLTADQHSLARRRMAVEHGITWQKILAAAVNAYVKGEFRVRPDGTYDIGLAPPEARPENVITFEDDEDAEDLETLLAADPGRPGPKPDPDFLGTTQLAELAEARTGRRVHRGLLRRLIRTRFPQTDSPGPGTRYRWSHDDPQVAEIIKAIEDGALDDLRTSGLSAAQATKASAAEAKPSA